MDDAIEKAVINIKLLYENVINNIDNAAKVSLDRAYGGMVRMSKGTLVENIADVIILAAWELAGGSKFDIKINSNKFNVPIMEEYLKKICDPNIKITLKNHSYRISVDRHVFIRNKFVLGLECKAYTENAMIKRILVDFYLLKTLYPNISCYLLQLESQLGGDFSECKDITLGSPSTHTLLSYFPNVDLNIITLVNGERKVDKPIHKKEHYKPINENQVRKAVLKISEDLRGYK